jgi:hypothetical protein
MFCALRPPVAGVSITYSKRLGGVAIASPLDILRPDDTRPDYGDVAGSPHALCLAYHFPSPKHVGQVVIRRPELAGQAQAPEETP